MSTRINISNLQTKVSNYDNPIENKSKQIIKSNS